MNSNFKKPIKVQLAFQGGGAKIYALIAAAEAIKEFEKNGDIIVTRIAGSSAGAIVAALYAANIEFSRIRSNLSDLPYNYKKNFRKLRIIWKLLTKKPILEQSLIEDKLKKFHELDGKKIKDLAGNLKSHNYPNTNEIKRLIITKTSIKYGENCTCDQEDKVIDSIMSSCRIPFVFGNGSIHAEYYDGGITNNLAINYLIDEADEFGNVIAITFKKKELPNKTFSDILKAVLFSSLDANVDLNLSRKRIFPIELDSSGVKNMLDFESMSEILKSDITNEQSPYSKNYAFTKNELLNKFLGNHFARKESIRSRLYQINSNIPKIRNENIGDDVKIQYPYTNIKTVYQMQDKLDKYLTDNNLWIDEAYNPAEKEEYFDAIQRPEIAVLNRAIYLFPFLLSRMRRNHWGVIDYGLHKAIGVVLSSGCELNKADGHSLKNYLKRKHVFKPHDNSSVNYGNHGTHWIDKLIMSIRLANPSGKLITLTGYLYNEIIPLMLLDSENSEALNSYTKISRAFSQYETANISNEYKIKLQEVLKLKHPDGDGYSFNEIELNNFYIHYLMLLEFKETQNTSALIFDLSYSYLIEILKAHMNLDFECIKVRHYQDIIVGIGFSLPSFEKLDSNENHWNKIQQIAKETLKNDELELNNIGIELDLSNLKQ